MEVSVDFCNTIVGAKESANEISNYLAKMSLEVRPAPNNGDKIIVTVPPTR